MNTSKLFAAATLALTVATLPACMLRRADSDSSSDGGGGAAATSQSSTGTGKGCDSQSSCNACTTCAANDQCAAEVNACSQNSSCVGLDECLQLCGNTSDCRTQCESSNLPGVADYQRATDCLYCDACPNACAGSCK